MFVSPLHRCEGFGRPCGVVTPRRLCFYCQRSEDEARPFVRAIQPAAEPRRATKEGEVAQ